MPRPLKEVIAQLRMVSANPAVDTTLIQTEDVLALCDAAEANGGDEALGYAQRLAETLVKKHWGNDASEWRVLPDMLGVLTQIDNATATLTRDKTA